MKNRFTLVAILGALGAIFVSMVMDGSNPMVLLKPAPMMLVFGGTFAASVAGFLRADVKNFKSVFTKAIGGVPDTLDEDISRLVRLAEVARREGLLALEKAAADVEDPFLRRGVEMIVDGNDPEEIRDILEGEIQALHDRHKVGAKFFTDMGGFAPTLGIIGTVVGLVHVLANLSNPGTLGPAIASAFTATLWGVMSANIVWLPIANKLKRASQLEMQGRRMILDGILAIQAGNSPRLVQAKLQAYLPPSDRREVRQPEAA
ncbi:MAG TPA: MotA/TolQ/ExbB proton channel family protein [Acidimicrobiales bacterium]|nr:MotA/TolQ/ExbB proton channel family protein [Acidimicrobiales bacterium]